VNDERFTGRVEEGKVVFDQPQRWRAAVARHAGKRIEITLQRFRQQRSLRANAYLWGVVYRTIEEWCGHTAEELHDVFKAKFLPPREITLPTGELVVGLSSTRQLTSEQFSEFVSKVKLFAAEQGLHVPEPDEVGDL
jgi:hypothetical protein